jgi:hypothetical protein
MTCIPGARGIPSMPPREDVLTTLRWRRHQLMAAGLDELSAHRIAVRAHLDIHAVLTLKDADADASTLLEHLEILNQEHPHG